MADDNENIIVNDEPTSKAIAQYPFKFDETVIPFFPADWQRVFNKSKVEMESEGGQRMVQYIRNRRLSIPFSCNIVDDEWVAFFESYHQRESFVLGIYSPTQHGYEYVNVEMTNYSEKVRKHSEKLTEVAGVWEISFTLEEF